MQITKMKVRSDNQGVGRGGGHEVIENFKMIGFGRKLVEEEEEEYKEEIKNHWGEIRDKQTQSKYYELTPDFTYWDQNLL